MVNGIVKMKYQILYQKWNSYTMNLFIKIIRGLLRRCFSIIFNILYLFSDIIFQLSFKRNKLNQNRIIDLENKHLGKRCFIIGNGPSLCPGDLEILYMNGEITFAANKISMIFNKTNWRPTYYSVFDGRLQRKIIDIMSDTPAEFKFFNRKSFIWTKKVKGNCLYLNGVGGRNYLKYPKFSKNVSQCVYTIATVTYTSLQLAAFMGFKEIYLIGMDNLYAVTINKDGTKTENPGIKSYFNESFHENNKCAGAQWEMNIAYETAKQYANTQGIKIINATRGGKLEIFPRTDFDSLFLTTPPPP
jgi:hypothetical protein